MDDDEQLPGPSNWRNRHGSSTQRSNSRPRSQMANGNGRFANLTRASRVPRISSRYQGPYQGQNIKNRINDPNRRWNYPPHASNNGGNASNDVGKVNCRRNFIGFKFLENIAATEGKETLVELLAKKDAFLHLIDSPIDKLDVFALVIEIISKVCQSSFDDAKNEFISRICSSRFISHLQIYLMQLPYPLNKDTNKYYWENQMKFWDNLINFCHFLTQCFASLAFRTCGSLIEVTLKACLDGLKAKHGFVLSNENVIKLEEIMEKLKMFETKLEVERVRRGGNMVGDMGDPPEDFRELSILPTGEDLLKRKVFLRPNIVNGNYDDVEHYLDVQFRILREDCFGPLREGVAQYMEDRNKMKYDNIRVFQDVMFVMPFISNTKLGSIVQIDTKRYKQFDKTNWANSKRFIYGSLILFTKDHKNFIVGTILDRNVELLKKGKIAVSLSNTTFNLNFYNCVDRYTMIESEVYFEPYYHVLKAMQDPAFPTTLAMQKYIVKVETNVEPPAYLQPDQEFTWGIKTLVVADDYDLQEPEIDDENTNDIPIAFKVLDFETWPPAEELGFDSSQYEAYKLALTHELAVIQGPPGAGKTYLGVKVAQTLLTNLAHGHPGCLMLIVCYTNHALDQFLSEILNITKSVVRIGGQSKNEAMLDINLNKLKQNSGHSLSYFHDQRITLRNNISEFRYKLCRLNVLTTGVIKSSEINTELEEIQYLETYYTDLGIPPNINPLEYWLFEKINDYNVDFDLESVKNNVTDYTNDYYHEVQNRTSANIVDNDDKDQKLLLDMEENISLFSFNVARHQLKTAVSIYVKMKDSGQNPHQEDSLLTKIRHLTAKINLAKAMDSNRNKRYILNVTPRTNFSMFSVDERWILYFTWIRGIINDVKENVAELQNSISKLSDTFEESRMMADLEILRTKKVIGMTTSGAARMRKMLHTLSPPIVVVEEAAEVLEQHIITSVTRDCKHLILIGDHQQLRPSAANMKLSRHYQIEVSLFERLINNGIQSRRLAVQHRMRPEIASLISPHIYPGLLNHPVVETFPPVLGMESNLFFFTHDFKEEVVEDNKSRSNHKEADMTLALANYLLQQGYTSEDITILAAYTGQMFYMLKERQKYDRLNGVKITVIDNYQGEESRIVLLSLVRNNEDKNIGFLGTENRICVGLSRAKEGFYIFGNMDCLKEKSELWKKIAVTLEEQNSVGDTLRLKCQNHPENISVIKGIDDFICKAPEGGCLLNCNYDFVCGHKCPLACHGYDRAHEGYAKCPFKCERLICDLNHRCPLKCAEKCGQCRSKVSVTLACGHEQMIYCYERQDLENVKCRTLVSDKFPDCEHEVQRLCSTKIDDICCNKQCEYRVESCGHACLNKCHVKKDPTHMNYICKKPCARAKKGCTADLLGDRGDHQCRKSCYETCEDCEVMVEKKRTGCNHKNWIACNKPTEAVPCKSACKKQLACGHTCVRKCFEDCGNCVQMVSKEIPGCGHTIIIKCFETPTSNLCTNKCERIMQCKHMCNGVCGKPCDPAACQQTSMVEVQAQCGHSVALPCSLLPRKDTLSKRELSELCKSACLATLACGHMCAGSCKLCHHGALHMPCQQPCGQIHICGHPCKEPCNQVCPPCSMICNKRCRHTKCGLLCGEPCQPCQERCTRRCPHGSCRRYCSQPCSHKCERRCERLQRCNHACHGLCGERCPNICRLCKPDDWPRDDFGEPYEDDNLFIVLEDCGHVFELEYMDGWMNVKSDNGEIVIRGCPVCRTPITNTMRYKDMVNKIMMEDVKSVKLILFGTPQQLQSAHAELIKKIAAVNSLAGIRNTRMFCVSKEKEQKNYFEKTWNSIKRFTRQKRKLSLLELKTAMISLDLLHLIGKCFEGHKVDLFPSDQISEEVHTQVDILCSVINVKNKTKHIMSLRKISEQQQNDFTNELKRLNAILQLHNILKHPKYKTAATEVRELTEAAREVVFTHSVFNEANAIEKLQLLQNNIGASLQITKQELELIISALNLKLGSWFKCPNGHYYCIGECGGAMEEARCLECDARVGGTSHRLRQDNRFAPEIDEARFPAWSERYNMENYRL